MKVLLVCADNADQSSFAFQCKDSFQELGHEVSVFNYRKWQLHRSSFTARLTNRMLGKAASRYNPDFLLTIKGESLLPGTIDEIKQRGVKTANWTLDEPFGKYGRFNHVKNLKEYDALFSFDRSYAEKMKKRGWNAHYLPLTAHPPLHHEIFPLGKRKYLTDVSFIGSWQQPRERLFAHLTNYDFKIYGYNWKKKTQNKKLLPHIQSPIFKANKTSAECKKMCEHFNLTKINLNVHHPQAINGGVNLRVFECLSTRSFLLTDHQPGIENMFKLNKEIVTFNDAKELKEKIDYYLAHDKERDKITQAGYERMVKEHKMIDRIRKMLKIMGTF